METTTIRIKIPHRPHINQKRILDNARRFNHIRCGRRFGKTELINFIVSRNLKKKVGIWFPTYKDLHKVWDVIKFQYHEIIRTKSETLHHLKLWTGGEVDFWSLDDPNAGRGFDYDVAIIDEAAKAKKLREAWKETIRPTLTDRKGQAWIFSTPKGTTNYFYTLDRETKDFKNWAKFCYTTYDNPYIDKGEIEEAKTQLDDFTFGQEYLAKYLDLNNQPFLYSFSEERHVKEAAEDEDLPIWLSFDFNKDPMTCIAAQEYDGQLMIIKQFKLSQGSTPEILDMIQASYPERRFVVTGDATGRNRSALERGNVNHWILIKNRLHLGDAQMRVRKANISLLNSRIVCNSVLQHKNVIIDPGCKDLIEQCTFAKVDEYGALIKDRDDNKNDLLDCFRYLLDAMYPEMISKLHKNEILTSESVNGNGYPHHLS